MLSQNEKAGCANTRPQKKCLCGDENTMHQTAENGKQKPAKNDTWSAENIAAAMSKALGASIRTLYRNASKGKLEVRGLSANRTPDRQYIRIEDVASLTTWVQRSIQTKTNAYFGCATRDGTGGEEKNCVQWPFVWMDFDFKDTPAAVFTQRIQDFPAEPTLIIDSGGGYHAYWRLKEPAEQDERHKVVDINRRLASYFGGDFKSCDAAHILRLPGSYNFKSCYTEPRPVQIISIDNSREYNLKDFDFLPEVEAPASDETDHTAKMNAALERIMCCAFMQHCRVNAATLSEPHWYAMITQLCREKGGVNLIHELSRPHPRYTAAETDNKIKHALNSSKPHTCAHIKHECKFDCGTHCGVASPAALAFNRQESPPKDGPAIPPMEKEQAKPGRPDGMPEGFALRKNGLCYAKYDKDGAIEGWIWICSELHVRAITYDDSGDEWGRLLEFKDPRGKTRHWSMPMAMTKGSGESYREVLLGMGLLISTGNAQRKKLDEYLTLAKPEKYARCVTRLGWYQNSFVLPDEVVGHNDEQVVYQHSGIKHNFNTAGALEEWQENVGKYCVDNSRLAFAGSAALVGPLLRLVGEEGGGVHYYGGSSVGKTTATEVAGSFVGGGQDGFLQSWRLTDNGLEGTAVIHNDSVLMLDEVSQVSSKVCSEVAYMLANGCGKTRAKRDGSLRPPLTWRVMFLSNGEQTFMDKIAEDTGRRIKAGQSVRVLDIPADAGKGLRLFEELHGFEDGNKFSKWLKENAKKYYGTPYRVFLRHVVANKDDVAARARKMRDDFTEGLCGDNADGQVKRVAGRFGIIAAAGEEAIRAGILPWPTGEAEKAASICFLCLVGSTWV